MEGAFQAHPIPQNVTNFEFHLVGDMTLKQFGYLGGGLGIAFLIFVTMVPTLPYLAWPLILIFALVGVAFAFLPIQERPLDKWLGAFIKAISKPTKLTYVSKAINKDDPFFSRRLIAFLNLIRARPLMPIIPAVSAPATVAATSGIPTNITPPPIKKTSMAERILGGGLAMPPIPVTQQFSQTVKTTALPALDQAVKDIVEKEVPKETAPKSEDLKKTVELAKEAQTIQAQIMKLEGQLSQVKAVVAKPGVDPRFYVEQFQALLTELQDLNKKASETAHQLAILSNIPTPPAGGATAPPLAAAQPQGEGLSSLKVTKIPSPKEAKVIPTLNLTTFPNVINGFVTDAQGNYIEGAIIVAHDKQNLPVRALKSNKLGQFVAATPLPNGVYTIVTEKDSLLFDTVSIELKGEIPKPVILGAKKGFYG